MCFVESKGQSVSFLCQEERCVLPRYRKHASQPGIYNASLKATSFEMSQNWESFDPRWSIAVLARFPTREIILTEVTPLWVDKRKDKISYLLNKLIFTYNLRRVNGTKPVMRRKRRNIFKTITF